MRTKRWLAFLQGPSARRLVAGCLPVALCLLSTTASAMIALTNSVHNVNDAKDHGCDQSAPSAKEQPCPSCSTTRFKDLPSFWGGLPYVNLWKDRLGNWTYAYYNSMRDLTNLVDRLQGSTRLSYCSCGALESVTDPLLKTTTCARDNNGRVTGIVSSDGFSTSLLRNDLGQVYQLTDSAGRNLSCSYISVGYAYDELSRLKSALARQLNLPGGSLRTNHYGASGELLRSYLKGPTGAVLDEHGYGYGLSFLRNSATRHGGVQLSYQYDGAGQLTNAQAREPNFGPVRLNESIGYAYDGAGNVRRRTNGVTVVDFHADKLNQLTNAVRSASMTVSGSLATNASSVTVNNVGATVYQDYTFSTTSGVGLADGQNTLTTKAVDGQNFTNTLVTTASLPRSVSLTYDSNGNLVNDGLRRLEYDGADRLTAVYVPNAWRTEFVYDGLSRRRITREKGWQGGTWVQTNETRYVYLGRSVVQERNSVGNPTVTYTRGLDLSGTFGGAGGIGGLLARTDASGAAFYHNDGAGNITTLINSSGQAQARYTCRGGDQVYLDLRGGSGCDGRVHETNPFHNRVRTRNRVPRRLFGICAVRHRSHRHRRFSVRL
jgi:YD repeat-containing protein